MYFGNADHDNIDPLFRLPSWVAYEEQPDNVVRITIFIPVEWLRVTRQIPKFVGNPVTIVVMPYQIKTEIVELCFINTIITLFIHVGND